MLLSHPREARTRRDGLRYEFCICNDDLLRAHIATQIVFSNTSVIIPLPMYVCYIG